MNVIEMEDGLCDPDLNLVINFVQFFYLGGLPFRQMHDVVWRVQGTIVVSLKESKPNREVMGCNLRGLKGNTSEFRFETPRQSKVLDLIETIQRYCNKITMVTSIPRELQYGANRVLCPVMFRRVWADQFLRRRISCDTIIPDLGLGSSPLASRKWSSIYCIDPWDHRPCPKVEMDILVLCDDSLFCSFIPFLIHKSPR